MAGSVCDPDLGIARKGPVVISKAKTYKKITKKQTQVKVVHGPAASGCFQGGEWCFCVLLVLLLLLVFGSLDGGFDNFLVT